MQTYICGPALRRSIWSRGGSLAGRGNRMCKGPGLTQTQCIHRKESPQWQQPPKQGADQSKLKKVQQTQGLRDEAPWEAQDSAAAQCDMCVGDCVEIREQDLEQDRNGRGIEENTDVEVAAISLLSFACKALQGPSLHDPTACSPAVAPGDSTFYSQVP